MRNSNWTPLGGLLLLIIVAPCVVVAEEPDIDQDAWNVLARMSAVLGAAEHVYFRAELTADSDLEEGRFIKDSWTTDFILRRPDRLFVAYSEYGDRKRMYYNGSSWTIHFLDQEKFGRVEMPGSIDESLDRILDEYGIVLPVADLLYSDVLEVLTVTVTDGYHAGLQLVRGVICDQIVLQEEDIDYQIWIRHSGPPLPQKFVIAYHTIPGAPQVTCYLSGWDFASPAPDELFTFEPTDDVEQIEVMNVNELGVVEGGSR